MLDEQAIANARASVELEDFTVSGPARDLCIQLLKREKSLDECISDICRMAGVECDAV